MAKSETCLINLSYQDGNEGSPSNPAKFKNQDFAQIKADYIRKRGQLFEDNEFPPNGCSLGDLPDMSPSEESGVKWLRPADLLREQGKKDKPAFCTDASFATNPQYRIQVTVIDKKEPGDKNIMLSLMEKPQQGNRKEIRLDRYGLNIYKIPPGTPQGRLQQDFFQRNSPVKAEKTYSSERDHIELHSLEPGEYVIIPSTYKPNITADFALAVYTKTDK